MVLFSSPYGARGARPIALPLWSNDPRLPKVLEVPGVSYDQSTHVTEYNPTNDPGLPTLGDVRCAWDIGPTIASALGYELPPPPSVSAHDFPGLARYLELGLDKTLRWYQVEAAAFMAARSWALHCDPMRSGKTAGLLASDTLAGSKRTLIVCPSLAKWVWAREIAKWTGESVLIVDGRAGTEAREYCVPCRGRGETADGEACPSCTNRNGQSYGYVLYEVLGTTRTLISRTEEGARYCPVPRTYFCPVHEYVRSPTEGTCSACIHEFKARLRRARYVCCNYDILTTHHDHYANGTAQMRADLPGQVQAIIDARFDVAILDEVQRIRGRPTSDRYGLSARDRLVKALRYVPIVWGATGTPIYSFTRDYYALLHVVSGGLYGFPHYTFDTRYCMGTRGAYRWEAEGTSILAETELKTRLKWVQIKRSRADLFGDSDKKVRTIYYIEPKKKPRQVDDADMDPELAYDMSLSGVLPEKLEMLVDHALGALSEGQSIVVWTKLVNSAKSTYKALEEAIQKRDVALRMKAVNAKLWIATGAVPDKRRIAMADAFMEHARHNMAGVFVATIDAFQVAASLEGATQEHFLELHLDPAANEQAEDRPFKVGCGLLEVAYYVVKGKGSPDMAAIRTLGPKFDAQERVTDDRQAAEIRGCLDARQRERLSAQAIFKRLTAHLAAVPDED